MTGYVKIHRKILESAEWKSLSPEGFMVMMTILLNCNYGESEALIEGQVRKILPGQWLTSRKRILETIGKNRITDKKIRTSLKVLETTGFLANEVTKGNHRIITVNKWFYYQGNNHAAKERANEGPTKGQRRAKSEEGKEGKEGKEKDIYKEIYDYWQEMPELHKHRAFKGTMMERIIRVINGRIDEGHNAEDIQGAIKNYNDALADPGNFYTYKWTLEIFLARSNGFPVFVDGIPGKKEEQIDPERPPDTHPWNYKSLNPDKLDKTQWIDAHPEWLEAHK